MVFYTCKFAKNLIKKLKKMSKQSLISIKNLECCYNDGQTVLEVEKLEIERGKLYVVLGVSGIGKSCGAKSPSITALPFMAAGFPAAGANSAKRCSIRAKVPVSGKLDQSALAVT